MLRTKFAVLGLVAVLGLASAACGDDDSNADTEEEDGTGSDTGDDGGSGDGGGAGGEEYVAAIVETSDDATLSEEETQCFAESMVAGIGVDAFEEAGVTPDDIRNEPASSPADLGLELSDDQLGAVWTAMSDCADFRQLFIDSITEGQTLTDEQKACISEGVDEDLVRGIFLASLSGDEEAANDPEVMGALTEVMTTCSVGAG